MSNIQNVFKNGKVTIAFLTCGDPNLETTAAAIHSAVENGASLIELSIPFSDPTAEGPVLEESSLRALKNGITTDKVFNFIRDLRRDITIPLIIVTYANVVYSYGSERFLAICDQIGIDGLLIEDLPFEEKDEFLPLCHKYNVDLISTITLVSANRIPMIAKEAEGFLYLLANGGQYRTEEETRIAIQNTISTVRQYTNLPCVVEYDYQSAEQMKKIAESADGIIIGSHLVKMFAEHGENAPAYIGKYIHAIH